MELQSCGEMRSTKADFIFSRQVGAGTYGVVWQAVRRLDGNTYAIKELDLRYLQKRVNFYGYKALTLCVYSITSA